MQNQPQQFDSFREYTQNEIAIIEQSAINYPKFVDCYDNVESFQKQYSTALTIENQIQIFGNTHKTEITRNLTIIEEDDPVDALQNAYEEEDEEDNTSQTARIQLTEKLWGTVIPEQKGKLLFWYERQLQTVGVVVIDNEFITVDQSFIQAYKGKLIIRQILRKQNAETRIFEEIVQTQSKLKEKVHVYLIITEDSIPFKRMQEVIQNCCDSHKVMSQIIRGQPEEATTQVQFNNIETLNQAQNLACQNASQKNITLIQGCPGGGKTTTAAYIIKNAMPKHKRILVCAGTNVAADNLCMAMKKIGIMSTRVCAVSREQNKVANQQYSASVHPDIMDSEIHMQCLNQLQPILQSLNQKINEYRLALHRARVIPIIEKYIRSTLFNIIIQSHSEHHNYKNTPHYYSVNHLIQYYQLNQVAYTQNIVLVGQRMVLPLLQHNFKLEQQPKLTLAFSSSYDIWTKFTLFIIHQKAPFITAPYQFLRANISAFQTALIAFILLITLLIPATVFQIFLTSVVAPLSQFCTLVFIIDY
ncbi:DNA_helicase [Hexamita inflata]|uniref:Putative n=1 Tax=Hexamita inflata TaxID=28002 RepID=A0AA86PL30_9EUKA|nr:DNA helicase [Hexamita inflata]